MLAGSLLTHSFLHKGFILRLTLHIAASQVDTNRHGWLNTEHDTGGNGNKAEKQDPGPMDSSLPLLRSFPLLLAVTASALLLPSAVVGLLRPHAGAGRKPVATAGH